MAKSAIYRRQGLKLADHEARIQEAVTGVREGQYRSVAHACRELKLVDFYATVNRRYHGRTKPRLNAHTRQQLLNPTQEKVLHNWIKFFGSIGIPLSKRTIRPKVEQLCGRKPSRKWVERFIRRNPDCTLGRGSGLDGQRARQFNFTNVNDHFEQVQKIFDGKDIPICNIQNFDEIGIQVGGGRKSNGELYLYSQIDTSKYRLKSDNLELVTVLETICADGTATVPPCFVFSGTNHSAEWYQVDDKIL